MDANKAQKLREVEYKINPTCWTCQHAEIERYAFWGTCTLHEYQHLKHSDAERELSIRADGSCNDHESIAEWYALGWEEFKT